MEVLQIAGICNEVSQQFQTEAAIIRDFKIRVILNTTNYINQWKRFFLWTNKTVIRFLLRGFFDREEFQFVLMLVNQRQENCFVDLSWKHSWPIISEITFLALLLLSLNMTRSKSFVFLNTPFLFCYRSTILVPSGQAE